jgi:hypothetical protein
MSEHEEQEAVFKVSDRRLFNPDGSIRDGVTIEKTEAKPAAPEVAEASAPTASPESNAPEAEDIYLPVGEEMPETADDIDPTDGEEEEIPGEQDPTSFVNFMMSLASQAAAALGAMPHPATGQRSLDLDIAKHWIDTMAMLREKTKGNLHPQEEKLLVGLLSDLRMQFVQISQAAEERLKQQAAQKFSSKDVLGGR